MPSAGSSNQRGGAVLPEVLINGRFLGQRITGVQRYAHETLRALDAALADEPRWARWTLAVPRGVSAPALRHIAVEEVGTRQGHAWEQLDLARRARGAQQLLGFGFTGPLFLRHQVVTVHDAAVVRVPQAYTWKFRAWYRVAVRQLVARASMIVAVSHFSRDEVIACFGARPQRVRVAIEGWQHLERVVADEAILDRHGLRGQPFALAVSSPTPNKNFGAIVKALAHLGPQVPRCVVAGASTSAVFQGAGEAQDSLLRVGYVSDGELKALYQHASCFVFPSFYEGFGLPPLEAMACGCPVIASTAPAVREVCGDAALYFDPHRPDELAQRLRDFFADPGLRPRLVAAARERTAAYDWARNAQMHLALLRELMGLSGGVARGADPALTGVSRPATSSSQS